MEAYYPVDYDVPHRGLVYLEWYDKHKVWHPGHDLNFGKGNDDLGSNIVSPFKAEVRYVSPMGRNGDLGHYVVLYHPELEIETRYLHLQESSVSAGDKLKAGQTFAKMGKSGTVYSHVHFDGWEIESDVHKLMQSHYIPYGFYPSHKSKAWVQDNFLNLLTLISDMRLKAKTETALDWCKKHLPEADWSDSSENEALKFRSLALRVKNWFIT